MNTTDIKLKIIQEIESLDKSSLNEFLGVWTNFVNSRKQESDWHLLTKEQKKGILDAIKETESGKFISHETVVAKFNMKYGNG